MSYWDQLPIATLQSALSRRQASDSKGVLLAAESESFSGPLPPPELLQHYESVHEGFAERIISMAEKEQEHRHNAETVAIDGSLSAEKRGQVFAFLLSGAVVLGSIYLIATGHEVSGSILAGGTLTGLAYIFITGRRKEKGDSQANDGDGA